jgi:hypothetical protein
MMKRLVIAAQVMVVGLGLGAGQAQAWNLLNQGEAFGSPNGLFEFPYTGASTGISFLQADSGTASGIPLNFDYREWSLTEMGTIPVAGDPAGPLQAWPSNPWVRTSTGTGVTFTAQAFDNVFGPSTSVADMRATAVGTIGFDGSGQAAYGRQFFVTLAPGEVAEFSFDAQAAITMAPTDIGVGFVGAKLLTYNDATNEWNFNDPLVSDLITVDTPGLSESRFLKLRHTFDNSLGTTTLTERVWLEGSVIIFAPVPEPSEWALMAAGLGLIARRARKASQAWG